MDNSSPSVDRALILPDSRLHDRLKGVVRGTVNKVSRNWVPVFCANCGKPYGHVPEENCSFACWLCDPCADKYGEQYGLAFMPDEVFWEKLKLEQLDRYGRELGLEELQAMESASCNPLSQLLKEGK